MSDREDLTQALALLSSMRDPDPCWFDHHGGCQAHGFLQLEPGEICPNEEARRLLESRMDLGPWMGAIQ